MSYLFTAIISLVVGLSTFVGAYKYLPLSLIDSPPQTTFGSTITTINGSDTLSSSRSVINTNFSNLNTDKLESGSTASTLTIGTLTLTNPLGASNGGTAQNSSSWTGLAAVSGGVWFQAATSSVTQLSLGALTMTYSSTTQFTVSNKLYGTDVSTSYTGAISPAHPLWIPWATTTPWTASTTNSVYAMNARVIASFSGTIRRAICVASTTRSFLGIQPYINSTPTTPSYFVASSTKGTITFTGNNTFSTGDIIGMNVGTTTSDSNANSGGCTFLITET